MRRSHLKPDNEGPIFRGAHAAGLIDDRAVLVTDARPIAPAAQRHGLLPAIDDAAGECAAAVATGVRRGFAAGSPARRMSPVGGGDPPDDLSAASPTPPG